MFKLSTKSVKKLPVNLKDLQSAGKLTFDLAAIFFTFTVLKKQAIKNPKKK
jgi:hypothetical protein